MKIRAFVTDVDGTVTEAYPIIDFDAASLMRNLERSGIRVLFASGRAPWELYSLSMFLGLCKVVVGENGAVVLNREPMNMTMLSDNFYPTAALQYLKNHLSDIAVKKTLPRFTEVVLERKPDIVTVRDTLKRSNLPVKVLDSGYAYHIVSSHVDKALGVREALRILDIDSSETVAIGDSETDVSLFELCRLGICVANGDETAKKNADYVTHAQGGQGFVEAVNYALNLED
ncbi:MAG: phosphoglycolate phosphatase [Conexivisphaerales archaeon]